MTREREKAVSSQLSQSFPACAVPPSREAGPQPSDLLPRSVAKAPPYTAKAASSPSSGSASPATKSTSNVDQAIRSTATLNVPVELAQLQPQQAEEATASHLALREEVWVENEELRRQLGVLLRIQEELERRYQQREAAVARVEQRHASEKKVLALEKEQALAQLSRAYEEQLQMLRNAEVLAQSNADTLAAEVVTLRRELSEVQDERRKSLEQQLGCRRQSDEAMAAQARMQAECATLRAAAADVKPERAAEVTAQVAELQRKLWITEERAAAAELALQALCSQLTAAAETTLAVAGADVQVGHTLDRDVTADAKLVHCSPTSELFSNDTQATAAPVLFDEAAVLTAVLSAMQDNGVSAAFSSSQRASSPTGGEGVAELSRSGSNGTSMKIETFVSQQQLTAPVLPPSADACGAPIRAGLSNAGLLRCQQHRQLLQVVLARVSDGYQRVAREATAAARAAKAEHALSNEVKELRARLEQSQQLLLSHERGRQDEDSHTHGRAVAGCQTTQSILQRRSSVGVVTDAVDAFSVKAPKAAAAAALQHRGAVEKAAYDEALAEAQRQLRHERSYICRLQKEVQSLRSSSYTTTVLEGLTNTVQNMRVAVCRLVRDAVADVQRIIEQEPQRLQAPATNIRGCASEMVWRDDAGQALRGRWRAMHEDCRHHLNNSLPARETDNVHCAATALPFSSPLLDFAFVRAVHKSILRAEAHVQQVSATLLRDYQRVFSNTHALLGTHKQDEDTAYKTSASPRSQQMSCSARDAVHNSLSRAHGACREAPSQRHAERGGTSFGGDSPSPSSSIAFSGATRKRTAQQQRVYAEMCDLLQRSAPSHDGMTVSTVSPSHHSPDGSHWLSGARPPQARPSGMNASPTSQLSPYVAAYVTEPAELRRAASSCMPLDSAAKSVTLSSDARLGFAHLADATQELRNVERVLDNIRDAEETREARRQQCLQGWQDAIVEAVDGVKERIEDALTLLRCPGAGAEVLPCDAMRRAKETHVASTLKAASADICADPAGDEPERARQGQNAQLSVSHGMNPVVPHRGPSRLSEVLSGTMRLKADGDTLLSA
ncbi:hypothetical protein LMJF_33_2330 [Leishmania major strain Friedlin]|uniref:Uncharacterized protein n=1 Tax=Leishmania major TaxID=5664 RepID=Q4Q3V4_LEIMA|nr:hypothetical protein LMJF_33_2330 [Leishmania major strain Friedlin]CAG9580850.1 hypothetical_protein_-_conserved [Leishmania major strain Friedlin]CAJ06630.1 hypothetical protein LMJF_33_2330 [Leishmania major strain Friedlin]|eukprot:XP_001685994.1 hypothetical protein LMJF_33_2330 [Leishmania major strain Friedlin]